MAVALPEDFVEAPPDQQARDLLSRLHQQTTATQGSGGRPPVYNAPDRWFARPDGHIVKLQGDAASQAYYVSKGFHLLTPAETKEWLEIVRPLVIKEQRRRATLITTLRRIATKHPGVDVAGDLDITPTEELEGMVDQIKTLTGGSVAVVMGRFREESVGPDISDVQLSSADELDRKKQAGEAALARMAGSRRGRPPNARNTEFQGAGAEV